MFIKEFLVQSTSKLKVWTIWPLEASCNHHIDFICLLVCMCETVQSSACSSMHTHTLKDISWGNSFAVGYLTPIGACMLNLMGTYVIDNQTHGLFVLEVGWVPDNINTSWVYHISCTQTRFFFSFISMEFLFFYLI